MSRGKGGGNKTDGFHTRRTLMYTKCDKKIIKQSLYGHLEKLYAKNVRNSGKDNFCGANQNRMNG